ncbi:MAG: adenylosuccinate lyase, partial [Gemmataceae bacterium]
MDSFKLYEDPLSSRYASREMAHLWSPHKRIGIWRRIWVALAEAQMELGLVGEGGPRILPEQSLAMKAKVDD